MPKTGTSLQNCFTAMNFSSMKTVADTRCLLTGTADKLSRSTNIDDL